MTPEERNALRAVQGYIHSMESFGSVDGPGIRYVLFLQGCPLRCLYCHNPDSNPIHGGKIWTAGQAVDDMVRYRRFIQKGGVTLSGGEPLIQPEFCTAVCKLLHEQAIHSALDTSGSEDVERVRPAIDATDLLLLDIKAYAPDISIALTGKDNRNAFATLDYCEATQKPVWIRHVIVPEYTLNESELNALADKLSEYTCIEKVELLAFHQLGAYKWESLGRPYRLHDTPAVTQDEMIPLRNIFRARGFSVQ